MENRCVMCGAAIPEGSQVCPICHKSPTLDDILKAWGRYRRCGKGYSRDVAKIDDIIYDMRKDHYIDIIKLHYIFNMRYERIASAIFCDISTVFRNKKRIMSEIARRYYNGAA